MIEFQSLISLFDGFNSAVKAYENYKKVSAIIRGEPDKIDVALQHLENINNKLEVVRLSEHIVQVPSIQSVRDITQTRQRQIELTEVRESLDPLQRALNSDLLASAMILTPDKMRHAMGKNPWEVLEDISPVNLARPHYDPNKVPIIFEHQSIRYLGWLKRGLLPVVFDCQFEDLPLNVPRPEIITPPPIISTSNNEEQRLQQLRNQTAELERQRKLAEQRRENQIKTREEEQQLKAQIREEQAKQYVLQHGELSAWNPLDWWRLLIWNLWSPAYLKVHREKFGQESEMHIAGWLLSTLAWLPALLATLAFALTLIPLAKEAWTTQIYLIVCGVIIFVWLLTAGARSDSGSELGVIILGMMLLIMVELVVSMFGSTRAILIAFSIGFSPPIILGIVGGDIIDKNYQKKLEIGKPSYFHRFLLLLLIAYYPFLIWFFYLKGWQYFK